MNERDRRFDLIVFDWDGTLMDSTSLIARSLQAACRDLSLTVPTVEQANHVIGLGLAEAIHYIAPQLPLADHSRLADRYRHHYLGQDIESELFVGVPELLAELRDAGYNLAIATGKARRGLDRVLTHTGLQSLFHATRCADETFSKPHPQMLLELMDVLFVEPGRTLMIGDTTHDLQMARNAGTYALGLTQGAHPAAELAELEPLAVLSSIVELRTWLRTNN
ncbi:HAD-IA family hydrolase [Uliginosibacterium sp. sgz301328]|uniref:HAD-IA family hydrolase n=1 Tax=Uliginosibacterium sp. sgz301328 TaxID=3243764 RepID=UPI00359E4B32